MTETATPAERVEAMNDLAVQVRTLADTLGHQTLMIENLMASHDDLVAALLKGIEMRAAQRAYFANRKQANLVASKVAEKEFDSHARDILDKIEAARVALAKAAQEAESEASASE
jgi:hypothetical protein